MEPSCGDVKSISTTDKSSEWQRLASFTSRFHIEGKLCAVTLLLLGRCLGKNAFEVNV